MLVDLATALTSGFIFACLAFSHSSLAPYMGDASKNP